MVAATTALLRLSPLQGSWEIGCGGGMGFVFNILCEITRVENGRI